MHIRSGQDRHRRRRAQSSPLGLLLVISMVLASTTIVVTVGIGAIDDTQGQLDLERTEKAMTQLDSQAALVALGQSDSQQVDFSAGSGSNYIANDSAGRMTLSYVNQSDLTETEIFSTEMGEVYYEADDGTTIAYQGGGVWRSSPDGGTTMISPPEFHYREATLTLPLVTVGTSESLESRAVISNADSTRYFPNKSMNGNFTNPMENGRVKVNVTSQYYEAWGKYFEQRTDGEVEYDHPNNRVMLTLVTPLQNNRITSATSSLSASGSFTINGGTNVACGPSVYTNSYDSSDADYCTHVNNSNLGDNGDVVYGGDIDISSGSGGDNIRGNVVSGNTVYVGNGGGKPYVYGNISYTTDCDGDCEDRITKSGAEVRQISGVEQAPAINGIIQTRAAEVEDENDNGATGNISSRRLDFTNAGSSDRVGLSTGTYYLTDLVVPDSNTVVLNTTEGDITIVVEENIDLEDNSKVKVVGDNSVSVTVLGHGPHTFDFYMGSSSVVTNDGDDAPQFRMLGQDNFTAQIGSGASGSGKLAQYVGVIYAPPGPSGTGSVTLDGGEVYGGILTGTTAIDGGNGGSIHYDEALQSQPVLERGASVVRVTYIHASTNEIDVTD